MNDVATWVVEAAGIVLERYGGDASRIWNDTPSAAELRARFDAFPGIGQKKAAMAVEILERDMRVPLADLTGSDIAYDVHIRRVFLRTGLVDRDEVGHMVDAARSLHPERPGELDNPAWDIGRRWCRPGVGDTSEGREATRRSSPPIVAMGLIPFSGRGQSGIARLRANAD